MSFRSAARATAYSKTGQWLFETPEYKRWRDPALHAHHHGFLWIKGKPGAGKSTIVKTLLKHASTEYANERAITFFFNARGEALERTTEGMYRSLLHQATANGHVASITQDYDSFEAYKDGGWPLELLKDLLREAIVSLARQSHLLCYIDALDEGDIEESVRAMIDFLEDLGETTRKEGLRFSVCLASRYYPNISILHLEEVRLNLCKQHDDDIETYVQSKLNLADSALQDEMTAEIKKRAAGVFLWVVLVVDVLRKSEDHGLRSRLDSIPDKLQDLFESILEKGGLDERFVPAIQWLAFARIPLSPRELYMAVMLSTDETNADPIDWNRNNDAQVVSNFILSASKGLIEIVGEPPHGFVAARVQFIHESVRECFLSEGLQKLDSKLAKNLQGISHARLTQWCRLYFRRTVRTDLIDRLKTAIDAHELWRLTKKKYPLLKYVLDGVCIHAEMASQFGVRQAAFDMEFPFANWLELKQCIMERTRNHPYHAESEPTLLHVLVNEGYKHLVDIELGGISEATSRTSRADLTNDTSRLSHPLHIAVSHGHLEIARALIQRSTGELGRCLDDGDLLVMAVKPDKAEMVEALLNFDGEAIIRRRNFQRQIAVDDGPLASDPWGRRVNVPLLELAVRNKSLETMNILLQHGADPNESNLDGYTPFVLAVFSNVNWISSRGSGILKILLDYGANVDSQDDQGRTALQIVAGSYHSVETEQALWNLLQHGADVNKHDSHGETALHLATRSGDNVARMMKLLKHGADPNACNHAGETALHTATATVCEDNEYSWLLPRPMETLELLLCNGAEVDAADNNGNTPLILAAEKGLTVMLTILLEHGASTAACNKRGMNALHFAVQRGNAYMVKTLLVHGADSAIETPSSSDVMSLARQTANRGVMKLHERYMTASGAQSPST